MTVRDYARQQVVKQVLEVEKPEILRVGLLKDEEIRTALGVTNHIYSDLIVAIAEGIARLANAHCNASICLPWDAFV